MLDRAFIRLNPDDVRRGIARKGLKAPVDELLAADETYRGVKSSLDTKRAEQNQVSKTVGMLMGQGKKEEAEEAKAGVARLKADVQELEAQERQLEQTLRDLELQIPNLPHESTLDGPDESGNKVTLEWGEKPAFDFQPKAHWDLGESLSLFDLPRGAKIAGSGFVVYTGIGARLQRALVSFFLDLQTQKNGYYEVYPPVLVNRDSLIGTGQLPKFEEDLYKVSDDYYLIPTAEVPVTNLYREEILDNDQLTIKNAAFTGCFRREAGSAGKDTRGIQRIHQFDKVELVKICRPEDSYSELETLVVDAESVLQALNLHYRVMEICTGDLSFGNCKQYDLEVWAPGVEKYLEISSCSNFEAFQARRAGIRFRRAQGEKPEFVHVLNGSGLATPRAFASILEQNQQADGSVTVPEVLRPYVGTDVLR